MQVQLIQYTPEPERTVAAAARLCYAPIDAIQLLEQLSAAQIERLLRQVIRSGHHSVLEHASFTFAIGGISRVTSHQLVRHRLASYSQQSQRYVSYERIEYVTPPAIAGDPSLLTRYETAMAAAHELYVDLQQAGVAGEDARYVLPNATATNLVVSMNARELRHFLTVRCCNRAQWEIRGLAHAMRRAVLAVAPVLFDDAGPACWRGPCPEGHLSCGAPPPRD
ncbi:MAG: FAD-dependent thymidylate synthase [Chloroflexi bacterium]|nr:FAD-dependent thymidylate synthase [Chloroflexota bacterium]MBU1749393.1 FAD-dependent thymidylate synthase [Chloroflexota bacterium]